MIEEYLSPFKKGTKALVIYPKGELAHENFILCKYAVDFLVPEGTPVLASRGGTVFYIKDDSDIWGLDVKFAHDVNYVAIDHGDGTNAEYLHLGKNTVTVNIGQKIKAGTELGKIGYSGCMAEPHLHMNVFKLEIEDGKYVPYGIQPAEFVKMVEKFEKY